MLEQSKEGRNGCFCFGPHLPEGHGCIITNYGVFILSNLVRAGIAAFALVPSFPKASAAALRTGLYFVSEITG